MALAPQRQPLMGEPAAPFVALHYDLSYTVDPAARLFAGEQAVPVRNDTDAPAATLAFLLHAGLQIDALALHRQGDALPLAADMQSRPAAYRGRSYQLVTLALAQPCPPHAELRLALRYHLDPALVTRGEPGGLDALTVDTASCYAVDAAAAHFPLLALGDVAALAAPYTLRISYPDGSLSCVPGALVASSTDGLQCQDTYESLSPNLPVFACAPYERVSAVRDGLAVELYHYTGQEHLRPLVDTGLDLAALYHQALGDHGVRAFQLATVGALNDRRAWAECRGSAVYFTDAGLARLDTDLQVRQHAAAMLAHELFHGWNLFSAPVDGPMSLWVSEGLANWAAAWALERLYGPAAGAACRRRYVEAYVEHRGHTADSGLGYLSDGWERPPNWHLIYNGGALVWEQLSQKLGRRAFLLGLQRFFRERAGVMSSAADLFDALQRRQPVELGPYLEPWLESPPDITLGIAAVERHGDGDGHATHVCLSVDGAADLELHTELGWRVAPAAPLKTMPIVLTQRGLRTVTINSPEPPAQVVVDPLHRLPLRSLYNLVWQAHSG
jgi:hypothetical protein